MNQTAQEATQVFFNKIVVQRIPGARHCVFRGDYVDSVSEYDLVSCDVDPVLKTLEYVAGPIPLDGGCEKCKAMIEIIANTPFNRTNQLDDPEVCIDDDVLDLMESRGVEVEYLPEGS